VIWLAENIHWHGMPMLDRRACTGGPRVRCRFSTRSFSCKRPWHRSGVTIAQLPSTFARWRERPACMKGASGTNRWTEVPPPSNDLSFEKLESSHHLHWCVCVLPLDCTLSTSASCAYYTKMARNPVAQSPQDVQADRWFRFTESHFRDKRPR
jgi:hypothetical protein